MGTTEPTIRSYARQITGLLRVRPGHGTPPAERGAWMQRKDELLAAVKVANQVGTPERENASAQQG